MVGEVIQVELPKGRHCLYLVVKVERPPFPKDYTNEEESKKYLEAVKDWINLHTGYINFTYQELP